MDLNPKQGLKFLVQSDAYGVSGYVAEFQRDFQLRLLTSLNIQLLSEIVMDRPSSVLIAQNKGSLPIVTKHWLKYLSRITEPHLSKSCADKVQSTWHCSTGKKEKDMEEEEEKKEKEEEEQKREQEHEELLAEPGWDGNSLD
ncbi:hypothetical protein HGM15179_003542 [Zosterops borbonicus]|uniref:Uncharacterized protein n=1 Tax=Zosterops borbonicus TaxID=364589 RepID=A0A8K1GSL8_9PASS|nr:hypothetical protein HGM15179_003542 [Zosterops borbonicus]